MGNQEHMQLDLDVFLLLLRERTWQLAQSSPKVLIPPAKDLAIP
jgi:hypothetical protein